MKSLTSKLVPVLACLSLAACININGKSKSKSNPSSSADRIEDAIIAGMNLDNTFCRSPKQGTDGSETMLLLHVSGPIIVSSAIKRHGVLSIVDDQLKYTEVASNALVTVSGSLHITRDIDVISDIEAAFENAQNSQFSINPDSEDRKYAFAQSKETIANDLLIDCASLSLGAIEDITPEPVVAEVQTAETEVAVLEEPLVLEEVELEEVELEEVDSDEEEIEIEVEVEVENEEEEEEEEEKDSDEEQV